MKADLPIEFKERMRRQLGDGYDAFINSYDEPAAKALRLNRRRIKPVDFARMSSIATCEDPPAEVPFWAGAYYYEDAKPGSKVLHDAGAYYIQEPSAMVPVTLLDVNAGGQKVLDLCAAPGGKTTQIADLMEGAGLLVSNEPIIKRAKILSENVERMGIENALVVSADPSVLADRFPAFFDRILVDAPCSGEGMFRKNPEAVSEWSPENVIMCADRQKSILDCAARMLSPGGKIVYSTCTFSPEEDEGVVEAFSASHPEFSICDEPVRLYPHMHRCEGHFAVSFCKMGDMREGGKTGRQRDGSSVLSRVEFALLCEFLDGFLTDECTVKRAIKDDPGRIVRFGDSIYYAPEMMPDTGGLKVHRAGLKLGTFLKNRFEPDHALSHALTKDDVINHIDLDPEDMCAKQFTSGMTLACDPGIKGWCLITVCGLGLGWGKADRGMIKNHYPRGLRNP
ncbi:MAG: RsmF rRNA methyltransferase first C-terminal domain-containing protein [Lachnospiraceae bacterium]|nr:RsmF rRNA methyltransferase first C-terminal domain-containing protein [Lachnospiraceae bacterium]